MVSCFVLICVCVDASKISLRMCLRSVLHSFFFSESSVEESALLFLQHFLPFVLQYLRVLYIFGILSICLGCMWQIIYSSLSVAFCFTYDVFAIHFL